MRWWKEILGCIVRCLIACLRPFLIRCIISRSADPGPLPGRYNAKEDGTTSMREVLEKDFFALELPKPSGDSQKFNVSKDEADKLFMELFTREKCQGDTPKNKEARVSLLFAFFAQHLSDAVFQSGDDYATKAPHEIVLNQIYGNTLEDENLLRDKKGGKGKLKTENIEATVDTVGGEFPLQLFDGSGEIKKEFKDLSYLSENLTSTARGNGTKFDFLKSKYQGKEEQYARAVGLFQGNLTLGNFALTSLFIREHNAICDDLITKKGGLDKNATDEKIFQTAKRINILIYIKIIIEDYINTIIGFDILRLPLNDFFYEEKRWCRETPIPYHFNILYRWHSMIPNQFNIDGATKGKGINAFLANNQLVLEKGLGRIFAAASNQPASKLSLRNTHPDLLKIEAATLYSGRKVLQPFNAHKKSNGDSPSVFGDFEQEDRLEEIYKTPDDIDFYVGVIGEKKKKGDGHKLFIQKVPLFIRSLAKYVSRHISSNRKEPLFGPSSWCCSRQACLSPRF